MFRTSSVCVWCTLVKHEDRSYVSHIQWWNAESCPVSARFLSQRREIERSRDDAKWSRRVRARSTRLRDLHPFKVFKSKGTNFAALITENVTDDALPRVIYEPNSQPILI